MKSGLIVILTSIVAVLASRTASTADSGRPEYVFGLKAERTEVVLGEEIPLRLTLKKMRGKPVMVNALRLARNSVSFEIVIGEKTHRVTRIQTSAPRSRLRRDHPLAFTFPLLAIRTGEMTITAVYRGLPIGNAPIRSEPVKVKVAPDGEKKRIAAVLETSEGVLVLDLWPDLAFNTVLNFLSLARARRYDGLTFHRIVKDFLVQGGDPKGDGSGGPGWTIPGEFHADLRHERGVISMARRATETDSAGCQFFLVHAASPGLNGKYAAFGKVAEGLPILDRLAASPTDLGPDKTFSKPRDPPLILTIRPTTR